MLGSAEFRMDPTTCLSWLDLSRRASSSDIFGLDQIELASTSAKLGLGQTWLELTKLGLTSSNLGLESSMFGSVLTHLAPVSTACAEE